MVIGIENTNKRGGPVIGITPHDGEQPPEDILWHGEDVVHLLPNTEFASGSYLLVLPKKFRNVSKIILIDFVSTPMLAGITISVKRCRGKISRSEVEELGWVFLENKEAGSNEQDYVRLMTHDNCLGGHMSLVKDVHFKSREDFFRLMKVSLQSMLECRKQIAAGTARYVDLKELFPVTPITDPDGP